MRILIFGGLTAIGASITNYFLQEGIETSVVKSTPSNEAEEEQELFFGRHALYRAIDSRDEFEKDASIDTVCFAGHFDERKAANKSKLFKDLETVLESYRQVETVILLSHAVVGSKEEDMRASTSEKGYFGEIEKQFSTHFESRDNVKRRLFILRLPNLTDKDRNLLSINSYKEEIGLNDMAKYVFELTGREHKVGVHTFQLSRNYGEGTPFILEEIQSLSSSETKK